MRSPPRSRSWGPRAWRPPAIGCSIGSPMLGAIGATGSSARESPRDSKRPSSTCSRLLPRPASEASPPSSWRACGSRRSTAPSPCSTRGAEAIDWSSPAEENAAGSISQARPSTPPPWSIPPFSTPSGPRSASPAPPASTWRESQACRSAPCVSSGAPTSDSWSRSTTSRSSVRARTSWSVPRNASVTTAATSIDAGDVSRWTSPCRQASKRAAAPSRPCCSRTRMRSSIPPRS